MLVDRYELLIAGAAADPARPLGDLDLWREADRRLVARANAGASVPQVMPTAAALIAGRLAKSPQHAALLDPDGTVHTRLSLARRAAALWEALADAGVGAGDVVAVAHPRSEHLAAAVLAAWSLRAAYVPLDPAQPPARLQDLLERSGAHVIVTDGASPKPAAATGLRIVSSSTLDTPDPPVAALAAGLEDVGVEDLAYVIFTSGSTGRPKGVEITHGNLANVVRHFAQELTVSSVDRVLWLTSFGFDISALELTLGLCHGGGAVVAPDEAQTRPAVLLDLVTRHNVAVAQATPTIWRLVAPAVRDGALSGLTVLCGGEPLSAALAQRLLRSGCRLFNVYGPTETAIWSTSARVEAGVTDPVSVGAPIAQTALYVLDQQGRDCPPGTVGELCIGGTGVARGYRGAPELTEQRFADDQTRGRYYRTGDLATWRTDGTVTLFGRVDRQVKLRGRRIELGELEAVLEQHPAVGAAAVVVAGDPQGDGRLVGYLQPAGNSLDLDDVRRHLRAALPGYLHPAQLAVLAALPRNPSGKVDHRALPELAAPAPEAAAPALPDDPLVAGLVALWRSVLGRDDLGERSNFFTSGGHSLLAAVLAARSGEEYGLAVSLLDVFDAPTPAELADLIRAQRAEQEARA
jgi:amino acid adenylation domain-containing protein